jgi:MFS family permease
MNPSSSKQKAWRRNFRAIWIAELLAIMGFASNFPIYTYYIQSLGVNDHLIARWSGIVISASSLSMGIMGPIWGALGDRRGRKIMVMRAMFGGMGSALVAALAMFAQAMAQSYWILLAAQVFLGFGIGGTLAVISAYIGKLAPKGRTGAAFGLDQMAVSLSNAVGPTVGGWLSDTFTRRTPLYTGGVSMAIAGAAVLLLPKGKDGTESPDEDGESK